MFSKPDEVAIAMPPITVDGRGSDELGGGMHPYKRQDTFGPSGMPITVQVIATIIYTGQ